MGDIIRINAFIEKEGKKETISLSRPHTVRHLLRKLDINQSETVIVKDNNIMQLDDTLKKQDKVKILNIMRNQSD